MGVCIPSLTTLALPLPSHEGELPLNKMCKLTQTHVGIILGTPILRSYLLNYARPLIYTTFLSYPSLVAIRTSYSFLQSPRLVPLQRHLRVLIHTLYDLLTALQPRLLLLPPSSSLPLSSLSAASSPPPSLLHIPAQCPQSPIFSIQLQEPKQLAAFLQKRGMMVRAVVPPTVPEGTQRVRVCLHAGNSIEEVRALVDAIEEWCVARRREAMKERGEMGLIYSARL
jgi:8-amino-7-oxononanoate synthase